MAHKLSTMKARRLAGGFSIHDLAWTARVAERTIVTAENLGAIHVTDSQRLLAALAPTVPLASNTQANPTVFTVTAGHSFQTGDTVVIAGNITSNADPNGTRLVTRISGTTFSVPVDCSVAGGTGGTARADPATLGTKDHIG
jgi:hypothetical protein